MQSRHEDDLLKDFTELISSVGTAVSENSVKPVLNKAAAEWKQHLDTFDHSLNSLVNRIEESVKALRNALLESRRNSKAWKTAFRPLTSNKTPPLSVILPQSEVSLTTCPIYYRSTVIIY